MQEKSLIGQEFGLWIVQEASSRSGYVLATCLGCGQDKDVLLSNLRQGRSRSCLQCARKQQNVNRGKADYIGKQFGGWRIIADLPKVSGARQVLVECVLCEHKQKYCLSTLKRYRPWHQKNSCPKNHLRGC
jgi:hypothetical protein